MPVSYSALEKAPIARLGDSAEGWRGLATGLATQVAEFDRTVVQPINHCSWHGEAAEAARATVRQAADRMAAAQKYLDANALLFETADHGIWRANSRASDATILRPEAGVHDDGRVSFDAAPESFPWDEPPIVVMMESQNIINQALHMAELVDRNIAPLLWYPQQGTIEDIPPVAEADKNLQLVQNACAHLKQELAAIPVDEQPHVDTRPQPRGDMEPTSYDQGLWMFLSSAVDVFRLTGKPHGADHLEHWLGNSGTTRYVSPAEMREDIPDFDAIVRKALADAPVEGCFDTGWQNTDVVGDNNVVQSGDWWYALNDFRYRVLCRSVVVDAVRHTHYTIGIKKPYVFGPPRKPIKIPYTGEEIDQSEIERLHHVGYAQNFVVQGLGHYDETKQLRR